MNLLKKNPHKKNFKVFSSLWQQGVKKDILCTDELEKKLPASTVFAHCIRYLKDHLLTEINKSFPGTSNDEVDYVLTVPAIWGERAKRFMREAAKEVHESSISIIIKLNHFIINKKKLCIF